MFSVPHKSHVVWQQKRATITNYITLRSFLPNVASKNFPTFRFLSFLFFFSLYLFVRDVWWRKIDLLSVNQSSNGQVIMHEYK